MLDKLGRDLGMGFYAGPMFEKLAREGTRYHELPYSVKGMDVAFSGMITAAVSLYKKGVPLEDIALSVQETAFAMLTEVTERAMAHIGKREVLLGGGVAQNGRLRDMVEDMAHAIKDSCNIYFFTLGDRLGIDLIGEYASAAELEYLPIAVRDGAVIRLRDVARISLEAQSYSTESGINSDNAAVLDIYMLPGANAMEVAESVRAAMDEISRNFPEGISYEIPFDMTTYIAESIHHVYRTLFEALLLVILVVFLSLQSWRATLIPIVAVPISLIGTFGVMLIFGFSLNMQTLLGLILAIGIVVDDAIVVVENVDRIMNEEHLSPYEATKKAMSGIGGALVAMSLVLCAVFVPVSFLSGITGQLYRQFTITIAVSVIISTVVALTLSPVMCSLFLRPEGEGRKPRIFRLINLGLARGNNLYSRMIGRSLTRSRRMFASSGDALSFIFPNLSSMRSMACTSCGNVCTPSVRRCRAG